MVSIFCRCGNGHSYFIKKDEIEAAIVVLTGNGEKNFKLIKTTGKKKENLVL